MTRISILLVAAAIAATATAACAGSIWAKANASGRGITADDTARKVGDILTIVVREKSSVETGTERTLDKKSDRTAAMEGEIKTNDLLRPFGGTWKFPKIEFQQSAQSKFDGSAEYGSDRSLTDQITVTVQDVLPNGNLVVLGQLVRCTGGDSQTVKVSGIVRTSDIAFDNSVRSEKVAEFRIDVDTHGQERLFVNQGWWDRILNRTNPF